MLKWKIVLCSLLVFFLATPLLAQFDLIRSFGSNPGLSTLALVGSTLYGTTWDGGSSGKGTIFKVDTDGSDYAVIHNFAGSTSDGEQPIGALRVSGTTLYGVTYHGGQYGAGTIFKISAAGTGFQIVYSFAGGSSSGAYPYEAPVVSGSTLYGLAAQGGANDMGLVYSVGTDGSGFKVLHPFACGVSDGCSPYGGLVLSGSTLYGMTFGGGSSASFGTVFKIDTDGNNYAILHAFSGGSSDGKDPLYGSLVTDGSSLYGMTEYGGSSTDGGLGVIFKISSAGTGFTIVHVFAGGASDGSKPTAGLILSGTTLFGMTSQGGTDDLGTIFSIGTDGTGYGRLHSFAGGESDGQSPSRDLILDSPMLYGTTQGGGSAGSGTVFEYDATPQADISLAKNASSLTPVPGADVDFTISASNNGSIGATGVTVTDLLPAGLTYVSYSTLSGTYDIGTGVWDIGDISAGATATLTLRATVNSSGTITNTATKTAENEPDYNTSNDSASATLRTARQKLLLPPLLQEPLNGSTGRPSTVTFKWQDTNTTPQEAKYKLRLKMAGGAYVNYPLAANTVQFVKSALSPGKVYYWNVQALGNGTTTKTSAWANGGVDFQFTVTPPVTLNAPTLVSPADNAIDQPLSVTLQWNDTNTSPQELNYKVRFKVAGGVYANTNLPAGTTSWTKSGLAKNKTYYWSVKAIGNGTSILSSAWPADRKFTTIK